jgi:putative methanogenesis marker 16 metalloprotein
VNAPAHKPLQTIKEINDKITSGDVKVITASELCDMVRDGEEVYDVDVVTSGTKGIMSGTYGALSFKVAEPNTFERAEKIWLNDVPAFVGPCPNERLGIVDVIISGTAICRSDNKYGGGHLLRALLRREEVSVELETDEGRHLQIETHLDEMHYAALFATRNAFKNYNAFINPREGCVRSIFSVRCLHGPFEEASFSGCGEINPLEKDPRLETIGIGTKVLLNGAVGYVTGRGTRSSPERPNLSGYAEMWDMNPRYIGGYNTSAGPDIFCSWAVPIPITNNRVLENVKKTDDEIPLPVVDVNDRELLGYAKYSDVWKSKCAPVTYEEKICQACEQCFVTELCPTGAFRYGKGIDKEKCTNCGACVIACIYGALKADLGHIPFKGMEIPVTLRQSDKCKAVQLMDSLKEMIERGEFLLSEPVGKITFR